MTNLLPRGRLIATACLLLAVLAWDAFGMDLQLARLFGGPAGFPLRDYWFFETVLHEGGRVASWMLVFLLSLSVWWPFGPLRRIDAARRLQLVVTALLAVLAVSIMKSMSRTSCPWDLAEFGRVAHYVSHWALGVNDGGSGRCFPAGHASAGFAFLGGFIVFAETHRPTAWWWLAGAVAAGLVFGLAQQVRGAHFMSHTLWAALVCWVVACSVDGVRRLAGWPSTQDVEGETVV